jgi:hypothetical protein
MKNVSIRGPIKDFRTNLSSFFTRFHFQCAKLLDFCQNSFLIFVHFLITYKNKTKDCAGNDNGAMAQRPKGAKAYLRFGYGHVSN